MFISGLSVIIVAVPVRVNEPAATRTCREHWEQFHYSEIPDDLARAVVVSGVDELTGSREKSVSLRVCPSLSFLPSVRPIPLDSPPSGRVKRGDLTSFFRDSR